MSTTLLRLIAPRMLLPLVRVRVPAARPLRFSGYHTPLTQDLPRLGAQCRTIKTMATKEGVEAAPYEAVAMPLIRLAKDVKAASWEGDLLCVVVPEDAFSITDGKVTKSEEFSALDAALSGILSEIVEVCDFTGKKGESGTQRLGGNARFVSLISAGPAEDATSSWGPASFQRVGNVIGSIKAIKAKTAAVVVVGGNLDNNKVEGLLYGALTAGHECTRFKSEPKLSKLSELTVLAARGDPDFTPAVRRAYALARGNLYARYLVEAPPNVCTPTYLAKAAQEIAAKFPDVMSCSVLEQAECEAMGMGCFLGVSECSAQPPKFIHLVYKPRGGEVKKRVALVGKGLTFDSGGYNIKCGAGSMIELMKFDMGGAGAVFGAARAIAEIEPSGVEIHFISASCENMIDGKGMRPGDILVSAAGKTVEIGNTDAEGRLTLADALWYAQEKVGAEKVVDIATLTGAQIVALGTGMGALMTTSDEMHAALAHAGNRTGGEKWWRMPLEDAYWEQCKSACADFKNTGGRGAGTITAGLFLKQFVDTKKVEWAHLDIAGPCWDEKLGGATGFGATSLVHWAEAQGK